MKESSARQSPEINESDWEKTPSIIKALVESLLSRIDNLEKQFETLKEENRELSAENKRLRAENEGLKEQLKRSSKNSSQPLSADKFKGFKALPKSGRKLGAQPGHAGKSQKRYPPESCERIENYYPQACDRKSCWMKRSIRRWSQSKEDKRLAVGSRHVFGNRLRDISLSLEGGCPADVDSRLWRYCRQ